MPEIVLARSGIIASRWRVCRHAPGAPLRTRQSGQAMAEYLIIVGALLAGGIGYGLFGEGGGLLWQLIDALRGFHYRFSTTLSLPL